MKNGKILAALLAVALMLAAMTACGGSGGTSNGTASADAAGGYYYAEDGWSSYEEPESWYDAEEAYPAEAGGKAYAAALSSARPAPDPDDPEKDLGGAEGLPRKLILRASVEMETTEFEETAAALDDLTAQMGGYYSSATSGDRGGSRRWASYTIRIPSKNFDRFLSQAGEIGHELREDITRDDISERYYDTEGRKRTQEKKLDRLQELLSQAEDMEDIITIMSAISDTEEQIESLSGTLSHWDSQVEYSTVDLELEEVARLSNVEVLPDSYGTRLSHAFVDGIRDFFDWIGDLLVGLAYGWLWIVLIAAVVIVIVRVRRSEKWMARRAAKKAAREKRQAELRAKWSGGLPKIVDGDPKSAKEDPKSGTLVNGEPVDGKEEKG